MSLKQTYLAFLSTPKISTLIESNPALHYVTTTQSVSSGASIINHFKTMRNQMEKKTEKVISSFETNDSLVIEMETTIEFKTSGGLYLPGLDDNFLSDQTVTFALVHIVNFQRGLIGQIRLYWDQSSILRQLGVIGKTGRNWPIKDGSEQCKLITSSVSAWSRPSSASDDNNETNRNRAMSNASMSSNNSIRPTRDPHSTLALFAPREPDYEPQTVAKGPTVPVRNSAKPPPRDLNDLFVGSDEPIHSGNGRSFAGGSRAEDVISPKAGTRFNRGRSFDFGDDGEEQKRATTPPPNHRAFVPKVNPNKYSHFEFGDLSQETTPVAKTAAPKSKNGPSWDFADFSTPEKKPTKFRKEDQRSFTWSENEDEAQPTPVKVKKVVAPRKDAEPHFSIKDTDTPDRKAPMTNMQNAAQHAQRDAAHFAISDDSPVATKNTSRKTGGNNSNRKSDEQEHMGSIDQLGGGNTTIYKTVGDGMGGRKTTEKHWYDFEDSPEPKPSVTQRKENVRSNNSNNANNRQARTGTQPSNLWDF